LLATKYGEEFAYYTRNADGSLPGHAMIVLDGANLGHVSALGTALGTRAQTEIIVVPAIGGG
jgi:hypothetical protein